MLRGKLGGLAVLGLIWMSTASVGFAAPNWAPGVSALVLQADEAIRGGNYDLAQVRLIEATKLEKGVNETIDLRLRVAKLYALKGQIGRARFMLTQISRTTTNARAWIEAARSYIYYYPYKIEMARRYLGKVLGANPKHPEALTEMGFCDLNSGALGAAKTTFEKVLKLEPKILKAHWGLAKILFLKREYSRAVDRLRVALQFAPEDAETMYLLGSVYLGSKEPRNKEAAMNWIGRAAEQDPGNIKYLAAGVFASLCRLRPADAEIYRKRMAKIEATNSYVLWTEGVYLELKGKVVQAASKFVEALQRDWSNLYAHYSLGNVRTGYGNPEYVMNAELETWRYSKFKNVDKAIENFETIASSPEIFPYLHEAKQRLRAMYEEPGRPDWSQPGFVKKLEKMRDYGRLFNPY